MIAFIFPGQGSQQVGMGKALAAAFDVCREAFEEADAALGEPISCLCFDGPEDQLMLTANTQPAILTMSVAVDRLLRSRGHAPAYLAGHSLGEYSAHVAAGTIGFADALRIVRRRGEYMQAAVPVGEGAMAAVLGLDHNGVEQACREVANGEVVSAANWNAPGQVTIAGTAAAVARAGVRARELGARRVMPLPVSAPFHCALMQPAEERLAPELRALVSATPSVPVVANVDAEPKRTAPEAIEALVQQVSAPVQWASVVEQLVAEGVTTVIEAGPGRVLSGLVRKIDRSLTIANVQDPESLEVAEEVLGRARVAGAAR